MLFEIATWPSLTHYACACTRSVSANYMNSIDKAAGLCTQRVVGKIKPAWTERCGWFELFLLVCNHKAGFGLFTRSQSMFKFALRLGIWNTTARFHSCGTLSSTDEVNVHGIHDAVPIPGFPSIPTSVHQTTMKSC